MRMLARLSESIRRRFARPGRHVQGFTDEEIQAHLAARAFVTGNVVTAERLDDGSVEVREFPMIPRD